LADLAVNFAMESYSYSPHIKIFEEQSPPYILYGRGRTLLSFVSVVSTIDGASGWMNATQVGHFEVQGLASVGARKVEGLIRLE